MSGGEKTRTDGHGEVEKGWDHDPPAKKKLVPVGILMVATGALMLLFGSHETSDAWVDALQLWWLQVRADLGHVKRLVIYLDNGPKNSGRRTQCLKRMVRFADWSGLEIRLVYYPPYHSKYNPIERCWSALEKKWNGVLLLQPQEFDAPVFGPPSLGVRLRGCLVPTHVIIHQRRRPGQLQLRLLQRRLQQPHRAVQCQLRHFFWRRFRASVTNRCASPTSAMWWCQPTHDRVSYCAMPR